MNDYKQLWNSLKEWLIDELKYIENNDDCYYTEDLKEFCDGIRSGYAEVLEVMKSMEKDKLSLENMIQKEAKKERGKK